MKATFRVPTREYAYIEVEFEGETKELMDKYFEIESEYRLRADKYKKDLQAKPPFEDSGKTAGGPTKEDYLNNK